MADGRICFSLYLAIQSSTPKLGENGHGLPPHKNMLLGSENRQDMPPKIDNNNEQKLDEYNIDDENEEDQGAQHSDEEQLSKSIVADEQPKQQSSIEEKSNSNFVVTPKPNQPNIILPVPPSNNNALDSKNTNNEEKINGNSLLAEDHPQIQQNNPNLPQSPILDKMGDAALETQ